MTNGDPHQSTKTVYDQLCHTYRAIDEFRMKLLGFLPLASGTGIYLLIRDPGKDIASSLLLPIGVFGFVITLGLFVLEVYGIMKCTALIKTGQNLECALRIKGQFRTRPDGVSGFPLIPTGIAPFVNEPFAVGIIYPAVLGAWTFVALSIIHIVVAVLLGITIFTIGLTFSVTFNRWLRERNSGDACMIEILFRAEVKDVDRSEFMDFIEWDARVAREEERASGTLSFDYHEDPKDQNAFFVYEAYRDGAAFEAHKRNDPYKKWESHIQPNIVTKFQILYEPGKTMCVSERLAPHEEAVLKTINEQFAVMEQLRDAKAKAWFAGVLARHLDFRRANGSMVDKEGFLKSLDAPNPFASRHTEDVHILALDDRALVFLIVRTTKADGTVNRYRNIRLFSKATSGWMLDRWWNYDVTTV